jgi:hypothetical protein
VKKRIKSRNAYKPIIIGQKIFLFPTYFLRNRIVANEILLTPWKFANKALFNFTITNNVDEIKMEKYLENNQIELSDLGKKDEILSGAKGYVLNYFSRSGWELFGRNKYGKYSLSSGKLGSNSLNRIFYQDIFVDPNLRKPGRSDGRYSYDPSGYEDPLEVAPFINFLSISDFLHIQFTDKRSLDEIKNITEYKIKINY